jgi:hypothetical protein
VEQEAALKETTTMKKLIATTVFVGALVLLLAMSGRAADADDVQIKSVDNYGGNSNVFTGRADITVTITEVDENGRPVHSWIGTTDDQGKVTIPAGHNLSNRYLKARTSPGNQQGRVDGVVVPDRIYDRQPFSFSAPQVVEGEVVDIKTVEGEVVQRRAADKYGRVFLAAGLPAGAYLISRVEGRPTPSLGRIQVVQAHIDPWDWMGTDGWVPIPIDPICVPPPAVKLNDAFTLSGHGFSPDFSEMQISLARAEQTEDVPVLAATAEQLKLGPVQNLKPGEAELKLTNKNTGRSAQPQHLIIYDLQGRLERKTLTSGEQTVLELSSLPEDVPIKVRAVISGKATFKGGHTELETVTEGGRAAIPVEAKRGSGNFHIDFEGKPVQRHLALAQALPMPTSAGKVSKATCSCGCGGTAQPRCAHKACSCSK